MAIQKGTGFTNLSRIMQANKGNKLSQTLTGGIQKQVEGVKTGVKSAQEQFQEEAEKNRLDTEQNQKQRADVLGRFAPPSGSSAVPSLNQQEAKPATQIVPNANSSLRGFQGYIKTGHVKQPDGSYGFTPPVAPAAPVEKEFSGESPVTEEDIKSFAKFRAGNYAGPKELKDSMALAGRAEQTSQLGDLNRSAGGRQELLRRFVGGRDYTRGQRTLDSSLMGAERAPELSLAARQARGTTGLLSGANAQAGNLAQEYSNRAKAFAEDTTKQLGVAKDPWSKQLDEAVTAAKTKEDTRKLEFEQLQEALSAAQEGKINPENIALVNSKIDDAIAKGYISEQDAEFLKGSTTSGGFQSRAQGLGLDYGSLLAQGMKDTQAQNMTRAGVASDTEIARLNALDRLAGKQGTDLEFLPSMTDKYRAGAAGIDLVPLRKNIYTKEGENSQKMIDDLTVKDWRDRSKYTRSFTDSSGKKMNVATASRMVNEAHLKVPTFEEALKINPEIGRNPLGGAMSYADAKKMWESQKRFRDEYVAKLDSLAAAKTKSEQELASLAEGSLFDQIASRTK